MSTVPDPFPSGYRYGRYIIQGELPPARMGRVYKALNSALGTVVAINVLSVDFRESDGEVVFFHRIRQALEAQQSKHDADPAGNPIKDICQIDGVAAVVVAYVEGVGAVLDVAAE